MHQSKEECTRVDNKWILIIDVLEILGDRSQSVDETRSHELGQGEKKHDKVSFGIYNKLASES